ncbi:MAG TPA: hypothetical protein VGM73_03710 [Candidatus Didemnitutus sp.]
MRRLIGIVLGVLVLGFAAHVSAVEGRVFVTSRGGEAIPLEGAVVRAYDAPAYRKIVTRADAARKRYEKLGRRLATLFEDAGEIPQQSVDDDEKTRLLEQNSAESRKVTAEIEAFGFEYLMALPLKPVAETRSDGEGRYVLPLHDPSGLVIVVVAQRSVATTVEHYCWIVFDPTPELNLSPANRAGRMPWEAPNGSADRGARRDPSL